jgi:hypothetical protein
VGNTYVVNTTQDGTGVGSCLTGGLCSFRQAVNQYNLDKGAPSSPFLHVINRDLINFAPCIPNNQQVCDPTYDIATYGDVVFDNSKGVAVTVTGNGAGTTKINGAGESNLQILGISAASVTLSDLTMYGGSSSPSNCGGGIYNDGDTVTVNNSIINDNLATLNGGGICNLNGTFNLNNSTVVNNATFENGDGGGIYNSGGVLQINSSTIDSNGQVSSFEPENGGGIYNASVGGTSAWLFSTTVDDNVAGTDGGGIYNGNFLEVLPASAVEDNTAGAHGGGVFNACGGSYPGGGVGVTSNTPDNVYQQCSGFPFPGSTEFPPRPA